MIDREQDKRHFLGMGRGIDGCSGVPDGFDFLGKSVAAGKYRLV